MNPTKLTSATKSLPTPSQMPLAADRAAGRAASARRILLASLGLLCVGLGTVGIFVPGLPTTVFLLLASFLFARSSPRLHRRLTSHPRLGVYLQMARERSMPLRAQVVSVAAIWGGIGIALAGGGAGSPWRVAILLVAGSAGTAAVLSLRGSRLTSIPSTISTP